MPQFLSAAVLEGHPPGDGAERQPGGEPPGAPGGKLRPGDLPQVPLELHPPHSIPPHDNFPTPLPPVMQNWEPSFLEHGTC